MRRFKNAGRLLALPISELDAAEEASVPLRWLFDGQSGAWRTVDAALEKRRANREAVGIGRRVQIGEDTRVSREEQDAEQQMRAQLLSGLNRSTFVAIDADDARIRAENALVRAVMQTASTEGVAA